MKKLNEPASRLYYLRTTARFGWTRKVLLNQIKAGAYEHCKSSFIASYNLESVQIV